MLRTRIIPALLLDRGALIKTRQFRGKRYVGDPSNTLRIFNELEVDELVVLDVSATPASATPDWELLEDIASECFMPLAYGGGLSSYDQASRVFGIGFEKVVINSAAHTRPELLTEIADVYGSQAVVASIDVQRGLFGTERVVSHSARRVHGHDPVAWAREVEQRGAGEILLTSVDREGTWSGFDVALVRRVADAVNIPVIAHGGAAGIADIAEAVSEGHASSVAVGSMVVFQKQHCGVLVNFPERAELEAALTDHEKRLHGA